VNVFVGTNLEQFGLVNKVHPILRGTENNMIAFVLSGGANYGALQAGALTVLLEKGINPDMLVGTSAGALNAAWLARDTSLAGARKLEHLWSEHAPNLYRRSNGVGMLFQLIKGSDGLYSNQPLQRLITKLIGPETTFGDLSGPRLYLTAVRLLDGKFYVFGDREDDRLLDGMMSSSAMTPFLPSWEVNGEAYTDGGLLAYLPLAVAIERGATEIYAFEIRLPFDQDSPKGILAQTLHMMSVVVEHQVQDELAQALANPLVCLHHLTLAPQSDPGMWNFSDAAAMISDGRRAAQAFLAQESVSQRQ
jgi:NTE family protein